MGIVRMDFRFYYTDEKIGTSIDAFIDFYKNIYY